MSSYSLRLIYILCLELLSPPPSSKTMNSSFSVSSVKSEKKDAAKPTDGHIEPRGKTRSATPVRSNRNTDAMIALSSVRKLLANSRLMLEGLELAEDALAAQRPKIIDLCSPPQDGKSDIKTEKNLSDPENVDTAPDETAATSLKRESGSPLAETTTPEEKAKLPKKFDTASDETGATTLQQESGSPSAETTTPEEKAKLPSLFDTSPIDVARLMFESATAEESVSRTFSGIKEHLESNLEIIRKAAEERETLMVLLQDKTTENAMLSSLMIELSDKQALMSEQMEREYEVMNMELEKKREMVHMYEKMYARVIDKKNHCV